MKLNDITRIFGLDFSPRKVVTDPNLTREEEMFKSYGPRQVILEWNTPGRLEQRRISPKFLRMFAVIGVVIGILLALMQDFALIIVLGSLVFFYYTLNTKYVPKDVSYQITNYGIKYGSDFYFWPDLRRYFFSLKGDTEILCVDTSIGLPGRLIIMFPPDMKEKIKEVLKQYLVFSEVEPKTGIDKLMDSVTSKLDFEQK